MVGLRRMSDPAFDVRLLTKPPGPFGPPLLPARATDLSRSDDALAAGSAAPWPGPDSKLGSQSDPIAPRTMIVGREVSVSAEITFATGSWSTATSRQACTSVGNLKLRVPGCSKAT